MNRAKDGTRGDESEMIMVTSSHIRLAERTRHSLKSNLGSMHFTPKEYLVGISTKCDKQTNTHNEDYNTLHNRCAKTTANSKLEHVGKEKETRSANDASVTGSLEIEAVDAVTKTGENDYYSDDSEERVLVIDLEEPVETELSSKCVGNSDGEMPVDELIDIYNNNADGDGRLQELKEHFGGESTVQIDQCARNMNRARDGTRGDESEMIMVTSSHIRLAERTRHSLKSNLGSMHFTPKEYLVGISTKCDKQTNTHNEDYNTLHNRCAKTYGNRKLDSIKNIEQDNRSTTANSKLEHVGKEKETRSANDASVTGSLEIEAVDAVTKTGENDYYSDDSEERVLVIDLEEPVETELSSKCVGNSDGEMPVDELIDIYNNNADGDGRLQELKEHFGGESTVQIDQCARNMNRARDGTRGDESEMIMACKICLETKGKLQRITSWEIRDAYRNLTGVAWDTSDRMPQCVCGECGARLRGTICLREKALASLRLLNDIFVKEPPVTSSHIRLAERTRHSLKSNLGSMHFTPKEYLVGISTKCDKQTNTHNEDYNDYNTLHNRCAKTYGNRKLDSIKNIEQDNRSTTGNSKLEHVGKEKETRSANDASVTGSLEIEAVDAVTKTGENDYYSDDSEERVLVIDLEEPVETELSSKCVGNSDGEMPVDELIDIYNNNADGDGRLQELKEHFGGESTVQIDQCWGVRREASSGLRLRAGLDVPNRGRRSAGETRKRRLPQTHKFQDGSLHQCMQCLSWFNKYSAYKSHLRRRHKLVSVCALCGSTFVSKNGLAKHRYKKHPDADQVRLQGPHCGPCDLLFASYNAYSRHLSLTSRHGPYFPNMAPSDVATRDPDLNDAHG